MTTGQESSNRSGGGDVDRGRNASRHDGTGDDTGAATLTVIEFLSDIDPNVR